MEKIASHYKRLQLLAMPPIFKNHENNLKSKIEKLLIRHYLCLVFAVFHLRDGLLYIVSLFLGNTETKNILEASTSQNT